MNAFLADPSLKALWQRVATALDRNGLTWRGRLTLPDLTPEGRRRLGIIIEKPVISGRRSVDLQQVATGVERICKTSLIETLTALGHAPAGRHEATQARRAASRERRLALNAVVDELCSMSPWITDWSAAAWRDGLLASRTPHDIDTLVRRVQQITSAGGDGRSRTELAAHLLGDAHALDTANPLTTLITRAFVQRDGPGPERAVWEHAGIPLDLVSAPVLTWALPLIGPGAVAVASRAMTRAALPLHLSTVALREAPLRVPAGTRVLVVENPRLVEAAAARRLPASVMCTNGNPTTAPTEAIAALRESAAELYYHGDFDTPGLAMTIRARDMGCTPFRMAASDYLDALAAAHSDGVALPQDPAPVPLTPWDFELATVFSDHRLIVHEERVMDEVLRAHAAR